jgi:hypothetical protein
MASLWQKGYTYFIKHGLLLFIKPSKQETMIELRLIYSSQAMFHPFAGNWYQDVGSIESSFKNL